MEIKSRFDHFNINVTDLAKSLEFYGKALGLKETGRKEAADGSFVLAYLGDGLYFINDPDDYWIEILPAK